MEDDFPEFDYNVAGGWTEFTRQYKENPTLENYIRLRRERPDADIEVSICGGIDWLLRFENEIRELGIDPQDMAGALDADPSMHSKISLTLIEKIIERENKLKTGESHLVSRGIVVSDTMINYIIAEMLDSLSWNSDFNIHPDLIVLIRHQLGVQESAIEAEDRKRKNKMHAICIAAQLAGNGIAPTYRKVAEVLKVQPSTVKRWFPEGNFTEEFESFSSILHFLQKSVAMRKRGQEDTE